jgi:hypothetical protein
MVSHDKVVGITAQPQRRFRRLLFLKIAAKTVAPLVSPLSRIVLGDLLRFPKKIR